MSYYTNVSAGESSSNDDVSIPIFFMYVCVCVCINILLINNRMKVVCYQHYHLR